MLVALYTNVDPPCGYKTGTHLLMQTAYHPSSTIHWVLVYKKIYRIIRGVIVAD